MKVSVNNRFIVFRFTSPALWGRVGDVKQMKCHVTRLNLIYSILYYIAMTYITLFDSILSAFILVNSDYGSEGRGFESSRAYETIKPCIAIK